MADSGVEPTTQRNHVTQLSVAQLTARELDSKAAALDTAWTRRE